MYKYAITGNIGSGKTTVCKVFESLGIKAYYADKEAKKFYQDKEVIQAVKALFGDDVFNEQDQLKSSLLAKKAFGNNKKLKQLNAIIHPLVLEDFNRWAELHQNDDYIIYESALLFESGFYKHFHKNILVTAPIELARDRVLSRDNISLEEFNARRTAQWDESIKKDMADITINNDEEVPLIPRIIELHNSLITL